MSSSSIVRPTTTFFVPPLEDPSLGYISPGFKNSIAPFLARMK